MRMWFDPKSQEFSDLKMSDVRIQDDPSRPCRSVQAMSIQPGHVNPAWLHQSSLAPSIQARPHQSRLGHVPRLLAHVTRPCRTGPCRTGQIMPDCTMPDWSDHAGLVLPCMTTLGTHLSTTLGTPLLARCTHGVRHAAGR